MEVECEFGSFCVAGFRPGSRATFVSAKVAKTSDAPSGLMRGEGRKLAEGGPTRRAQTRSARDKSVPPLGQPAGVRQRRGGKRIEKPLGNNWKHKCFVMNVYRTGGSNFRVDVNFCDAGFRPGGRATFVSAKVAKTSDAPSGLIRGEGRKLAEGGPTRRAQTRSARDKSVPPLGQPAGVGAGESKLSGMHINSVEL